MSFSSSLLNFHTHNSPLTNENSIQNRYNHFESVELNGKYSIGMHPWYIKEENWEIKFASLKNYSQHKNVAAIGECGLDKVCKTDFTLQKNVFTQHILLANQIHKPLIIHCVKAWQEVLQLLRKHNNHVPIVFHGFNGKLSIAKQIIGEGHYLSFGKALLTKLPLIKVLRMLPLNKLFLETDDADVSIEVVYQAAANALDIDINSLSLQINHNAAQVLGSHFFFEQ